MTVEVFDITDAVRLRAALEIRTAVFVREQGVPPDEEIDAHDRTDRDAVHALACNDRGQPIGAGRYYVIETTTVQIGRMAVLANVRGSGAGRAILAALLTEARRRGFGRARLHAQTHACGFYRQAGFYDDGPELWDAGILHQPMSMTLA